MAALKEMLGLEKMAVCKVLEIERGVSMSCQAVLRILGGAGGEGESWHREGISSCERFSA